MHVIRPNPTPARECDAIAPGTCLKCGYPGPHADASACISALRDRVAEFEIRELATRPYSRREKRQA